MVDFTKLLSDPEKIGVILLLMAAVAAFFRGWIVTGLACEAIKKEAALREERLLKERDEFKEMAMRGLELTRRSIDVAHRVKDQP